MNQDELAKNLESSFYCGVTQFQLRSMLKQRCHNIHEGVPKAGDVTNLKEIYTELYITEGGTAGVSKEHEVRRLENTSRKSVTPETTIPCEDIFKGSVKREGGIIQTDEDRQTQVRTVLTMGVAGIGKTVLTQKFCLDWAEGRANQDIHLLFPFTFRELNTYRDMQISLAGLVQHIFSTSIQLCSSKIVHTVFIFDGLDETRLSLDFTKTVTDPTEPSSVGGLLANLIKGSLLPYARVWITTRPAAVNEIPAQWIDMVTEVRGFADPQKELYFRKRFKDKQKVTEILSHIKKSRSLYTMCQIPVFCWITSTVLKHEMMNRATRKLPSTLTKMYIHLLVVQAKLNNMKYVKLSGTEPVWTLEYRTMVLSLGKLAFEQLEKRNLIFYESDLEESGLDSGCASKFSGIFTEVFKAELGLYRDKVYCFVHFSVQEFLAALHVHVTFVNTGVNLLKKGLISSIKKILGRKLDLHQLHQTAIDMTIHSSNGQWDLFLCFLLGLSQLANEKFLQHLLDYPEPLNAVLLSSNPERTVDYIHKQLKRKLSAEKSCNLFHCLNELEDQSLVKSVQQHLKNRDLSSSTSPEIWSGMFFLLLSSDNDLSVFDLKEYSASEEALQWLLPVVKVAKTAMMTYCNLSFESCKSLSSILSTQSSSLQLLDLSNNDLYDIGVKQLCDGLKSLECRLKTLRLSGCMISEEGGAALVSALCSSSYLKELDLSYNHPEDATIEILFALQEDPCHSLDTCILHPAGKQWLTPGVRKYVCKLTMDPNSANNRLELSEDNRMVTMTKSDMPMPYSDNPERFDSCLQVLCSKGLRERCYWEVDWEERMHTWQIEVAVSYRSIERKGGRGGFGISDQSWCLRISRGGYLVVHEGTETPVSSTYYNTDRVAVYLDYDGGSLTFFKINHKELLPLHSFTTTFTEPLYAGFGFNQWSSGVSMSVGP
ncbi:protein NLRC3-like [Eucyclogobius newberryi]|uniref:protein NLRC3-like n=1 Tax=Eucyclogobius newberryi TaxID=166745 RepID=UPI003B5C9E57